MFLFSDATLGARDGTVVVVEGCVCWVGEVGTVVVDPSDGVDVATDSDGVVERVIGGRAGTLVGGTAGAWLGVTTAGTNSVADGGTV